MNLIGMSKTSASIAALGAIGLLAACSPGLSGKYVDSADNVSLTFQSGGKVLYQAGPTGHSELDTYTVSDSPSGKQVTIKSSGGTVGILFLRPNGCLLGPVIGELCKPKPSS